MAPDINVRKDIVEEPRGAGWVGAMALEYQLPGAP